MKKNSRLIAVFIALVFSIGFLVLNNKQKPLNIALDHAGSNRTELEKVVKYYSKVKADSLKLKAARFLISNMKGRLGIEQELQDRSGNKVKFDFSDYCPGEHAKLNRKLDSLGYRFVQTKLNYDLQTIQSNYLIENIDLAFEVWQYPWCKHLSFNQFCEYILPYRCQTEPLSNYRKHYKEKFSWLIDSMKNQSDPVEAATILKSCLKKEIKHSSLHSSFYRGYLSPKLMEQVKVGKCGSLANYCVLVMRSCGIPITFDKILYWAKSNSGHVYNSIISHNDIEYRFSLPDRPPMQRKLEPCSPKVWRSTFQFQNIELPDLSAKDKIHPFFLDSNYIDITNKYADVSDLELHVNDIQQTEIVYLCTYNYGRWRPVSWNEISKNGKVHFTKTTKDLLYSLAIYKAGFIRPIGLPFYFDDNENIIEKYPIKGITDTLKLTINPRDKGFEYYDNEQGRNFVIYYFEDKWIPIHTIGLPGSMLNKIWSNKLPVNKSEISYRVLFDKIPSNSLLRKNKNGKIFFIKDNRPHF